jgi:hypothetical protein
MRPLQDEFGLVWIGTEAGLASYDGNKDHQPRYAGRYGAQWCSLACMDKDGRLWTGHFDGGITMYDGNTFTAYTLGENMHSAITAMVQADDGSIWIDGRSWSFPNERVRRECTVLQRIGSMRRKVLQTVLLTGDEVEGRSDLLCRGPGYPSIHRQRSATTLRR